MHVYNISQYQSKFASESAQMITRYKERLWAYTVRVASAAGFAFATTELFSSEDSQATVKRKLSTWLPSPDESVGLATFFVFFFVLVKRRKVYIVDDALRYRVPHGHRRHNLEAMLDDIKSFGGSVPVILLSSNEGIGRLFSDKNETTFRRVVLPAATSNELLLALHKAAPSLEYIDKATLDAVKGHLGMEHHVNSVRWWMLLAQHRSTSQGVCLLQSSNPARHLSVLRDRELLRYVALQLDLQCEEAGRAYALAHSQRVDVGQSLRGYFTQHEIQHIAATIPTKQYPRRRLLCTALLLTSPVVQLSTCTNSTNSSMDRSPAPHETLFVAEVRRALTPAQGTDDCFPEDPQCTADLEFVRRILVIAITPQHL